MQFRTRSSSNRVLFLAFAFLAMQLYALYISTFHIFHGMPPMCQLCAAVKKYENSVAASINPHNLSVSVEEIETVFQVLILVVTPAYYLSRAPPSILNNRYS